MYADAVGAVQSGYQLAEPGAVAHALAADQL
jgi:hypothetical protein